MPRIVKTNPAHVERILAFATVHELQSVLTAIAESALDDSESGADTAAVVYEQLARLGIIVP